MMDGEKLTYNEIAARLKVSVRTVRRKLAAGLIPARTCGRRVLFDFDAVWNALPDAQLVQATNRFLRMAQGAAAPIPMVEHLKQVAKDWHVVPDELAAARLKKERGS